MLSSEYSESSLTDFPEYLKSIDKPPHLLHYRGDISLIQESKRVAVVGTRTPSSFGVDECRFITTWFVKKVEYNHGLDIPQTSGNAKLIKEGKAFGLNRDNLLVFEGMLREKLQSQ